VTGAGAERREERLAVAEATAISNAALVVIEQLLIEIARDRPDPTSTLAGIRDGALARVSLLAANPTTRPLQAQVEHFIKRVIELAGARFQRKH
jgi:hypothetical protein